jgi:hypothetical protein
VPKDLELGAEDRSKVVVEEANLEETGVYLPLDRLERFLVRRLLEDDQKSTESGARRRRARRSGSPRKGKRSPSTRARRMALRMTSTQEM